MCWIREVVTRHTGCILVYRYTEERNINKLRHNSMYGYENNRNSLVYRYTRTAPVTLEHKLLLYAQNVYHKIIANFFFNFRAFIASLKDLSVVSVRGQSALLN